MVDRISLLADEVLCHILSFLPTEQAAATCVLSKRWKFLWTSVPALDYNDQIYLKNNKLYSCFENFVYATILTRNVHQPITSFTLKLYASRSQLSDIDDHRSNAHINVWVNTAIRRGIQNLDIELWPQNYIISLNCSIFSSQILVVLKLKGLSLNASSSSAEFPSLKSLHVENVNFVEPRYLMELLYGCPMLEDLKARWIDYDHDKYDVMEELKFKSLPKLVRADIRFVWMDETSILLKTICNVEFLRFKQFQVVDEVPEFPNLRHLGLALDHHSWHSVLLMLKNCPKLQSFKLDLHGSAEAEDALPYPHLVVPLTSHFTKCYLKYFQGTESDLQFAKYIMQNSSFLQSITIHKVSGNPLTQLKMLKELALCPRSSTSCKLSFD